MKLHCELQSHNLEEKCESTKLWDIEITINFLNWFYSFMEYCGVISALQFSSSISLGYDTKNDHNFYFMLTLSYC